MDFFKKLFGLEKNQSQDSGGIHPYFRDERPENGQDFDRFYNNQPEEPRRGFDVFTDPLQMHQYFEQQMDEVLKSFGFQGSGNMFGRFSMPGIEEDFSNDESHTVPPVDDSKNIREHFLKKGYEKPSLPGDRQDKDVDGTFNFGDIESVLKGKSHAQVVPFHDNHLGARNFSFGQSMSSKVIRNADGSTETHKSVKDNAGNEEITVTRRFGEKEYTIIKKRDKDGKEEVIENFINMDEKDKDKFLQPYNNMPHLGNSPQSSFPFDKFFK